MRSSKLPRIALTSSLVVVYAWANYLALIFWLSLLLCWILMLSVAWNYATKFDRQSRESAANMVPVLNPNPVLAPQNTAIMTHSSLDGSPPHTSGSSDDTALPDGEINK